MNLQQWLSYLEKLHPSTIDMGLDRIEQVAAGLGLDFSASKVITVAGTNGKGSTVTLLSHILQAAGKQTATYTSPHLQRYNERVCLGNREVSDEVLCEAMSRVESVRREAGVSLTYFEFGTLAALLIFSRAMPDYLILEVGLGGRLDAVNIIDSDLAIVTNVALDHMDWLGDSREAIGREKAGVYRSGKPALFGESEMPDSVRSRIEAIGAIPFHLGRDFSCVRESLVSHWHWQGSDGSGNAKELQSLPLTGFALDNLATVLQAVFLLEADISRETVLFGLANAHIRGRFERIDRGHEVVLDVAHNPHAAANLARSLDAEFPGRRLHIVIAMLGDKDMAGVLDQLLTLPARWYVAEIHEARGCPAKILYNLLADRQVSGVDSFDTIVDAFRTAEVCAKSDEVVVVTGSFFTVSAVLGYLEAAGGA